MTRQHAIVAFSGHMTDAPDRASPRFPERAVPSVRARVRQALAERGTDLIGVSSAARGGDLIFIQELTALGGTAIVLLPFPRDGFKETSVGHGWDDTFDRVLSYPNVEVRAPLLGATPTSSSERDAAYEACNVAIIELAEALAQRHGDADPLFLAVYMKTEADAQGGTAQAFDTWTARGHRLQRIDPRSDG